MVEGVRLDWHAGEEPPGECRSITIVPDSTKRPKKT